MIGAALDRLTLPRAVSLALTALALLIAVVRPAWLAPGTVDAAALGLFTIGFWATGVIPEYLTALAFFLIAMLFHVAPPGVIFSGFESAALWLVFGGLVIGVAIRHTGLGDRLAHRVADNLHGSYVRVIGGIVLVGVALAFVMPSSMGRVVLLTPIALSLAQRFGFLEGSNGRCGVVLATVFGANVPAFGILPANVPNMILVGSAETLYGVSPAYGQYLLLHFPVLGLLRAAALVALIVVLFPDTPRERAATGHTAPPDRNARQRVMIGLLLAALVLWGTDFLHHISPAWVALAVAVVCLWPGSGLLPPGAFSERISYGPIFFVAGIMGLGALMAHSGLGDEIARALLQVVPLSPAHPAGDFAALVGIAMATGLFTTAAGVPAVLAPLAPEMAKASGLPLETVLMTQVVGFSTMLLPYQVAPLVVGMRLGGQGLAPAVRLTLSLAAVGVLVLIPLDYLWWRLLGWL